MASKCASHEAIKKNISMLSTSVLDLPCTVKEEPITDYVVIENIPDLRGACDTGWNMKNINVDIDEETVSSSLFAGIGEIKTEVKDEVTVEENIIEENSYTNPLNHDVNPVLIPDHSVAEEETICFIDVDTLKIDHLSCAKSFSNPLPSKEDLTVETVRKCGVESSSSPLDMLSMQPFSREGECPRKRPMLQKTVPVDWPDWAEQKLRSSLKQDKKIKTGAVKLSWMRQQKQTTEQHILEVRLLKTLGERQFQSNGEQAQKDLTSTYTPYVKKEDGIEVTKACSETSSVNVIQSALSKGEAQQLPLKTESESSTDFNDHTTLTDHIPNCTEKKLYPCCVCDMSFDSRQSRISHVMANHRKKGQYMQYICHECGKQFLFSSSLKTHENGKCGSDIKYSCDICSEEFYDIRSQVTHATTHVGVKFVRCKWCNEALTQHSDLEMHNLQLCVPQVEVHQQPPPLSDMQYICHECGKQFLFSSSLKTHENGKCGSDIKYSCDICSEKFSDIRSQVTHATTHVGVKFVRCKWCNEALTQHSDLEMHNLQLCIPQVEVDQQPPSLSDCKKLQNSAATPILKVIETRGHLCKLCGKMFRFLESMVKHQRCQHRIYICSMCDSRFHYERSLIKHVCQQHNSKEGAKLSFKRIHKLIHPEKKHT